MMDDNRDNDYDFNVLYISKSSFPGPKRYFCNHCNRALFLNDKDTQEYVCSNCNIIYYPNNQLVKKANKFDTPEGSDPGVRGNKTSPTAMIDEPNRELSSTSYQQRQKLPSAYEALKKSGFNFIGLVAIGIAAHIPVIKSLINTDIHIGIN